MLPLQALVNSVAEDTLIDLEVATLLGCQLEELDRSIPALALDGNMFTQITHQTSLVTLTVSGNHHYQITLKVTSASHTPLVLGHPWLMLHSPHIDWSTGSIKGGSLHCYSLCLHSARPQCVTDLQLRPKNLSFLISLLYPVNTMTSQKSSVKLRPYLFHHTDLMIAHIICSLGV